MSRIPKRTAASIAALLSVLVLLAFPSCGRKAMPEPRRGGAGTILSVPAARVAAATATASR